MKNTKQNHYSNGIQDFLESKPDPRTKCLLFSASSQKESVNICISMWSKVRHRFKPDLKVEGCCSYGWSFT